MKLELALATKAFIVYRGKVLIIREAKQYRTGTNIGSYDLPGGQIKPGERFDICLRREVKEETGLAVKIGQTFFVSEWRPRVGQRQLQIVGIFFRCLAKTTRVHLSRDHDHCLWLNPKDYQKYPLIANLKPVFRAYLRLSK